MRGGRLGTLPTIPPLFWWFQGWAIPVADGRIGDHQCHGDERREGRQRRPSSLQQGRGQRPDAVDGEYTGQESDAAFLMADLEKTKTDTAQQLGERDVRIAAIEKELLATSDELEKTRKEGLRYAPEHGSGGHLSHRILRHEPRFDVSHYTRQDSNLQPMAP